MYGFLLIHLKLREKWQINSEIQRLSEVTHEPADGALSTASPYEPFLTLIKEDIDSDMAFCC